eukprot:147241-Hanusia_phi.AAC.1
MGRGKRRAARLLAHTWKGGACSVKRMEPNTPRMLSGFLEGMAAESVREKTTENKKRMEQRHRQGGWKRRAWDHENEGAS